MSKSTFEIRQTFLNYFSSKGHKVVDDSSLVSDKDPTLLFTNAGMNQFKDIFLGLAKSDYLRVTTSQRCVRAGGKHNDLENVGYTAFHHTFFEMLGNFSFGDYFKREAIQYAWELLTSKSWFNLPKEQIWVTVYESDDETYEIWEKEILIPSRRIIRIGDKNGSPYNSDNFWRMGDIGPCGPCTEIFYDYGNHIFGEPPGNSKKKGDRYIEIWNIVFMQFNCQSDGTMELLPKPSVDTGMGLERIASVIQHVDSSYKIDIFCLLIKAAAEITGTNDINNKSLRVIVDHIRSSAFLLSDGVYPSNEGRGYVLRRIIRRAIRHGNKLGVKDTFFYKLVNPLIEVMGIHGEKLKYQQSQVEYLLRKEEEQFAHTVKRGLNILYEELAKIKENKLDGKTALRLYDTYGLPIDLTEEVCNEHNVKIDKIELELATKKQRSQVKKFRNFNINYNNFCVDNFSEFCGYNNLELNNSRVIALFVNNKKVNSIKAIQEAVVVLDKTPFYAESGGQVGDKGNLKGYNFIFKVNDTQKHGQLIFHFGKLISGSLEIGNSVQALVDKVHRVNICLNHSAIHLLHAALRKLIGSHIKQKGSLVNDKILRFDFSHFRMMKTIEIHAVEDLVNAQIRRNLPIKDKIIDLETAKSEGAIALFNEKYNEKVRVLSIGDFSTELCIGTHAIRTGDIGLFRIVSEFAIASGTRRIEAITGKYAIDSVHKQSSQLYDISKLVKGDNNNIVDKTFNILKHIRQLEKEVSFLREELAIQRSASLSSKAIEIKGIKLLVSEIKKIQPKMLRIMVDNLKIRLGSTVIVLATVIENKVCIIVGVSKDLTNRIKAWEIVDMLAQQINGKGGGHSSMAEAGGRNIESLPRALTSVRSWVNNKLLTT